MKEKNQNNFSKSPSNLKIQKQSGYPEWGKK